jgi:DNA repair protein RecO (recombination protein O)
MNWIDSGYLVSKNKYNENSIIAEVYTTNHGKYSGIIFGASSKKIKNYLQIGNLLHINYSSKNENQIGFFKVEIIKALTPLYFDQSKKLMCIASAMNLIKFLTVEAQENLKIFDLISDLFIILDNKEWIKEYIFWELKLFKFIGYDLELKKMVKETFINNNKEYYVQSNNEKKIIPNFLIDDYLENLDNQTLIQGLRLVGDYLDKTILKPNNINFPSSRLDFVNILK